MIVILNNSLIAGEDNSVKVVYNKIINYPANNILYLEFLGNTVSLIGLNYEYLSIDYIKILSDVQNAKSYTKVGLGFDFYSSSRQSIIVEQNIIIGGTKDFLELGIGTFYSFVKRNSNSDQFVILEGWHITSNISFRHQNYSNESNSFLKFSICPIYSFKLKELNFGPSICWGIIF